MKITQFSIKLFAIYAIALVCSAKIQAAAAKVSKLERAQINAWLKQNNKKLNHYGEPINTVYTEPFKNGVVQHIISKHPDKPWSTIKVTLPAVSENTQRRMLAWLYKNGFDMYGNKAFTVYKPGENPLRQPDGKIMNLGEYLLKKFPNKPWKKVKNK